MATVLEIACRAHAEQADDARRWHDNEAIRAWSSLPSLMAFDLYVPSAAGARDPMVDDGAGPLFLVMLEFPSPAALKQAAQSRDFATPLSSLPAGLKLSADPMERLSYPVAGQTAALPLSAPFSYSVRYHRPAEDEARFVDFYLASHPPLLARLPNVRNVICYLPVQGIDPAGLPSADYMLGNEVVFDSIEAFNAAMASEARRQLRADFSRFPRFTGRNTHHPMERTRIVG
ncbi:MAG: EthD family reductase [Rhizobiales bacterium]|nr:EthD family reductase [Hyphomicrobiales bacterium]